ncbi:MAG: hypothetical protein EAZ06_12055 [Cytophagales bacterium]|nr:MAG: hypothetical protein EAZ06_12055 [Cytophagales bacterium]
MGGQLLGDVGRKYANNTISTILGYSRWNTQNIVKENGKSMTLWGGLSGTVGNKTQDATKGFYDYISGSKTEEK